MPQAIPAVIAAVGSAAAASVPAAGLVIAGIPIASGIATAGIGLITAGLQFGAQMLFAPDEPRASAARQIGTLPPLGTRYIALGRVRSGMERGAHIVHRDADDDDVWWQFMAISYSPVSAIVTHYIDGEAVTVDGSNNVTSPSKWNGLIRIQTRLGLQTAVLATADTAFSYWGANHIGQGIAYAAIRQTPVGASRFRSIYPNHFVRYSALINGAFLPDPAGGFSYSNNAARAVLWHLLDDVAGYGLSSDAIDLASFADYAAVCDQDVPLLGGGTEKRYTTNGFVDMARRKVEVLRDLLNNCDADLVMNDSGLLEIVPFYRPPIYSLTNDNVIGLRFQAGVPEEQRINAAVATYTSPALEYASTTSPPYNLALREGEPRVTGSVPLPFCTSGTQAQRLAKKAVIRQNPLAAGEIQAQLKALHVRPTEYVTLDNADDFVGEPLRIQAREILMPQGPDDAAPMLSFQVLALDPDYDVWVPATDEKTVSDPPAVNAIGDIISPPTITSTSVEQVLLSGALGSRIVVNFDTETSDIVAELEWSVAGEDEYEGPRRTGAQNGVIRTGFLGESADYDVRLRFVLRDGTGSTDWTSVEDITVQADSTETTNGTVSATTGSLQGQIDVEVTAPTDPNYYRTQIKYAIVTGSETFSAATSYGFVLVNQAGGTANFTITGLSFGVNYRIWAQSQNASGVGPASPVNDTAVSGSP